MKRWHAELPLMQKRWRHRAFMWQGRKTDMAGDTFTKPWGGFLVIHMDPDSDWTPRRRKANEDELGRWPLVPLDKHDQWAWVAIEVMAGTLPRMNSALPWAPVPMPTPVSSEVQGYGRFRKSLPAGHSGYGRKRCRCCRDNMRKEEWWNRRGKRERAIADWKD